MIFSTGVAAWIINPDTFELFAYTLQDGRFPLPAVADLRKVSLVWSFPT